MLLHSKHWLRQGLILLSGIFFLAACAPQKPPFFIPPEKKTASKPQQVKAKVLAITKTDSDDTIVYQSGSPQSYIVQKGDTLWDISAVFLRDPWFWPEIWYKNPQVENPHLIYPGDELSIIYVNGQRRVQLVKRGTGGGLRQVKLQPKIHAEPIDASIPSIPIEAIRHLLAKPLVIDQDELDRAAYILASVDNHLVNSLNDQIYVRKLDTRNSDGRYQIFRPNKPIFDPDTNELLGYEAIFVGQGKLLLGGDPATVRITESVREVLRNDKLLPIETTDLERDFFPKPPANEVKGHIVSLFDAISQLGRYQTVAINLGQRDSIASGDILEIRRPGKIIRDEAEAEPDFRVRLPDEKLGIVMVIKSFEKMSYALIMEAIRPVNTGDFVASPN